jgi:hypothetical protein
MNPDAGALDRLLEGTTAAAREFLARLPERAAAVALSADEAPAPLPEGMGEMAALEAFRRRYEACLSGSAGPRYWGFVTGGTTPAALSGDWLVGVYDQNVSNAVGSAAAAVEREAAAWLRELFGLPADHEAVFVTGATQSNTVALATAREWAYARLGHDAAEDGLAGAPRVAVLAGAAHSSIDKSLAVLGLGRRSLERLALLPGRTALDMGALSRRLGELSGQPAIVVASAGEVNTGDFDDLAAAAAICREHGAWLHVDGAFGLFAALSPRHAGRLRGVEGAGEAPARGGAIGLAVSLPRTTSESERGRVLGRLGRSPLEDPRSRLPIRQRGRRRARRRLGRVDLPLNAERRHRLLRGQSVGKEPHEPLSAASFKESLHLGIGASAEKPRALRERLIANPGGGLVRRDRDDVRHPDPRGIGGEALLVNARHEPKRGGKEAGRPVIAARPRRRPLAMIGEHRRAAPERIPARTKEEHIFLRLRGGAPGRRRYRPCQPRDPSEDADRGPFRLQHGHAWSPLSDEQLRELPVRAGASERIDRRLVNEHAQARDGRLAGEPDGIDRRDGSGPFAREGREGPHPRELAAGARRSGEPEVQRGRRRPVGAALGLLQQRRIHRSVRTVRERRRNRRHVTRL